MDAMVDTSRGPSLASLGYTDVGLDDAWQLCGSYGPYNYTYHAADGTPQVNLTRFPSFTQMTAYAHALNLTAGTYGNNCKCKVCQLIQVTLGLTASRFCAAQRAILPTHPSMHRITAPICCVLRPRSTLSLTLGSTASRFVLRSGPSSPPSHTQTRTRVRVPSVLLLPPFSASSMGAVPKRTLSFGTTCSTSRAPTRRSAEGRCS